MGIPVTFAKIRFELEALEPINLPLYAGSTLRGGFGHAFKRAVCCNRDSDCGTCILADKCVYNYVFETPPPASSQIMRKYPAAPHPFIISPPSNSNNRYAAGDVLHFELVLIGKAIDCLPYFIHTFERLGQMGIGKNRGRYRLLYVRDSLNENSEIYDGGSAALQSDVKILDAAQISEAYPLSKHLTLEFLTPTRLKFKERYVINLQFHILLRNLLRRISLLSYFHCGEELRLDFKSSIKTAESVRVSKSNLKWYDWERYSSRQETRMRLGGFVGSISFVVETPDTLIPFIPFIALGEYLNIGKGTTFGLGKYKIYPSKDA